MLASRRTALLLGLLACAACDPTPENIARWKETEKGPGKLREVVKKSSLQPGLRGQAFAALVEIGMAQDALADLASAPEGERQQVAREAAPRLIEVIKGSDVATTRAQREAKDALFLLRDHAAPEDRARTDDALIAWTTADLIGRQAQGGQSSDKILTTIGARAVPRLVELCGQSGPNQLAAAALVARIGDDAAKARASEVLVEAARRAAKDTRDVPDQMLRALGQVGGARATAFLIDQAEHGTDRVRQRALLALGQGASLARDSAALAAAMRIAGDAKAPGELREAAFQVAEKVGPAAVPELLKLMHDANEKVRWRSVEAALHAGGEKAVVPVLEQLDASKSYTKDDLDSFVVHDLKLIGAPALPALKGELASKNWVARVVAVRAIANIGRKADAAALDPLLADATKLRGFSGNATLGQEAKAAKAALAGRP
jgi:HEAT repeat protein